MSDVVYIGLYLREESAIFYCLLLWYSLRQLQSLFTLLHKESRKAAL